MIDRPARGVVEVWNVAICFFSKFKNVLLRDEKKIDASCFKI